MSDSKVVSPFSAVDASLGYLYQVRIALLWALRRLKTGGTFQVSVEILDDVALEGGEGSPTELLQTKHHRSNTAALTDSSPDLWKTLRIWFEGSAACIIPSDANLCLVTTGVVPDSSAASHLRATARDVTAAREALDRTAESSSYQANHSAYETYLKASSAERETLLGRVLIVDASPTISQLDNELRKEVYWAAAREHHAAFLERLEGWWVRRIISQLTGSTKDRVGSLEIESCMSDLREQFKREALPIDDDLRWFAIDDETAAGYCKYTFVRQLEIAKIAQPRVMLAIADYYKAYAQRSRWLRDELVVDVDFCRYEQRLIEEWTRIFETMREELGEVATEDAKIAAARAVLKWADEALLPIRPGVAESFICRGSLHILSDAVRIGWHPEFRDRIAALMGMGEQAA